METDRDERGSGGTSRFGPRKPTSAVVVVVASLVLLVFMSMTAGASAHPGHRQKELLVDRWYQTIGMGGQAFMTLNTYTSYHTGCNTTCQNNWTAVKNATIYNWNNSPTTVWFSESSSLTESNDVRATVVTDSSNRCALHFGYYRCVPASVLGIHFTIAHGTGGSHSDCNSMGDCYPFGTQENSIRHEVVILNHPAHSGPLYGTQFQRQATMVHEFGHVLSLAHDGMPNSMKDGYCGNDPAGLYLMTVMDYDCLDSGLVNGPKDWDHCGVNHAYYDPAWGYSGC